MATQHLGIPDGLEQLESLIQSFPPDGPVIFFGPSQQWDSSEILYLTSYLAWPRKVWLVATDAPGERTAAQPPPASSPPPGALIFFEGAPPANLAARAQSAGPKCRVVINP